jgi:hypothetical protein
MESLYTFSSVFNATLFTTSPKFKITLIRIKLLHASSLLGRPQATVHLLKLLHCVSS